MINFVLGVILTLLIIGVFLRVYSREFFSTFREAKSIYEDLEKLFNQCEKTANIMVNDLELQIKEGKELLATLEDKTSEKKFQDKKSSKIKINKKKNNYQSNLTPEQNSILELAYQGLEVKEISRRLEVGQDQVAMVLELYK